MRALITGTTGNIGKAACKLLLEQGWEVVGVARNQEGLALPGESIHENLRFYEVDLTHQRNTMRFCGSSIAPYDLVIMTHGVQHGIEIGNDDFPWWYRDILAGNLDSAVYLTDGLIHCNRLNPGALIVYCSSIQATQPRRGRGPYSVAKAGLEALARIVAVEQAGKGIRAVALRLGQLTETMRGVVFTEEQRQAIEGRTPLPWVEPVDVAKLCLALYEQKSLSGAVLDVDSAHSLNIWP